MTKEEAVKEIEKAFEPAFANYIITALTEGATASDKEQEPCEDAVSKAEVLNLVRFNAFHVKSQIKAIENMPSVTPHNKIKGHWKVVSDGYSDNAYICECSECKDTVWVYKDADRKWNYCPNCGADMR